MAPPKTSSCQTDETQSWLTIWLVPRLFGVLPTHWRAVLCADVSRSAFPPRAPSGVCASAFLSTSFVDNRPVRLGTVSYRGQSKECKKGSQSGHQRANQSFMDFPVKDTQQGSPSSRCGSRVEVFLGPSVCIQVMEVLCTVNLKIQDFQKQYHHRRRRSFCQILDMFILAHVHLSSHLPVVQQLKIHPPGSLRLLSGMTWNAGLL